LILVAPAVHPHGRGLLQALAGTLHVAGDVGHATLHRLVEQAKRLIGAEVAHQLADVLARGWLIDALAPVPGHGIAPLVGSAELRGTRCF
jgi:hypothetical protein